MRLYIEADDGIILECGGTNVVLPHDENERSKAFQALTDALALLSGITPLLSSSATEGEMPSLMAGKHGLSLVPSRQEAKRT